MELISLKGPHRIIRFSRDDREPGSYWYRSETVMHGLSLGSSYATLAEAEEDFLDTLEWNCEKRL